MKEINQLGLAITLMENNAINSFYCQYVFMEVLSSVIAKW